MVYAEEAHLNFLVQNANPVRCGLKLLLSLKKIEMLTNKLSLKVHDLSVTIQQQLAQLLDFKGKSGVNLTEGTDLRSRLFDRDFDGRSLLWYLNETRPEELLHQSI